MVSVPIASCESVSKLSDIFDNSVSSISWYNPVSHMYEDCTDGYPDAHKSYWVCYPSDLDETISGYGFLEWTHPVKTGWNMIGSIMDEDDDVIWPGNHDPSTCDVGQLYIWDASASTYLFTDYVSEGQGCWYL